MLLESDIQGGHLAFAATTVAQDDECAEPILQQETRLGEASRVQGPHDLIA